MAKSLCAIALSRGPWVAVGGVGGGGADNVRGAGFQSEPPPTMYFPQVQAGQSACFVSKTMALIVLTVGDPSAVARSVRGALQALDKAVPVSHVESMNKILAGSIGNRRAVTSTPWHSSS